MMSKITDQISEIAEPIIKAQGLELVDIEYVKEGSRWYLRVFIEKLNDEVTVEDCEKTSKMLSDLLDDDDPINESYILEVSSPGLERPLKKPSDFERFKDELVYIKTYGPINGDKEFTGTLLGKEEEDVLLKKKGDDKLVKIPYKKIASARLAIDFG